MIANEHNWMRATGAWLALALGVSLSGGVHARSVSASSPDHRIVAMLSDDAGALELAPRGLFVGYLKAQ